MRLLDSLSVASPGLRAALISDGHLRHKYGLLRDVSQAAHHLLAGQRDGFLPWHVHLTHLLDPADRERLLASALQSNNMGAMGEHVEHLSATQRNRLVEAAQALPLVQRRRQLQGLIKGLPHLTPEHQDAIVNEVLDSPLGDFLAKKELAESLQHLKPAQRIRVVNAIDDVQDPTLKGDYICSLATGMAHLEPAQRQFIVDTALALRRSVAYQLRGHMLGAVGAQAGEIDIDRRSAIAKAGISDTSIGARTQAMVGLARGAAALTEAEREQLVAAGLALPQDWSRCQVFRACSEHAGNFNGFQRSRLISALANLPEWQKADLIEAFSKSAPQLTEEDRTELLQAARNITSAMSQSTALASLGSGAEALAVIRNSVLPPGNHAVRTWGERPIARLCDGVERLSSDNRQELLDLVGQLHWIFRVRSIESLCGRLSHLNEAQRHMVKEMVVGLEDSPQKAQLLSKLGHGINAMKPPSA